MLKETLGLLTAVLLSTAGFAAGPPLGEVGEDDDHRFPLDLIELGRDLFLDPILSGTRNIACAVAQERIMGPGGAWDLLATRVRDIPDYRKRF